MLFLCHYWITIQLTFWMFLFVHKHDSNMRDTEVDLLNKKRKTLLEKQGRGQVETLVVFWTFSRSICLCQESLALSLVNPCKECQRVPACHPWEEVVLCAPNCSSRPLFKTILMSEWDIDLCIASCIRTQGDVQRENQHAAMTQENPTALLGMNILCSRLGFIFGNQSGILHNVPHNVTKIVPFVI